MSLRFVQNFVKKPCDVRHRRHGVLVVDAGRSDDRQRSHDIVPHASGRADQHKIPHRGQRFVQPDDNSDRFLPGVEISPQQLDDLLLFFQGLQQFLQALTVLLAAYQIGCSFDENDLRDSSAVRAPCR